MITYGIQGRHVEHPQKHPVEHPSWDNASKQKRVQWLRCWPMTEIVISRLEDKRYGCTWAKAPMLKEEFMAVSGFPFNFKSSKKSTGKPCASHRSLAMPRGLLALTMIKVKWSSSTWHYWRQVPCLGERVLPSPYFFLKKKIRQMVSRTLLSGVLRLVCLCSSSSQL